MRIPLSNFLVRAREPGNKAQILEDSPPRVNCFGRKGDA